MSPELRGPSTHATRDKRQQEEFLHATFAGDGLVERLDEKNMISDDFSTKFVPKFKILLQNRKISLQNRV